LEGIEKLWSGFVANKDVREVLIFALWGLEAKWRTFKEVDGEGWPNLGGRIFRN